MKSKAEKLANEHEYTIAAKPKRPTVKDLMETLSDTFEQADKKLEAISNQCCKKIKEEDVR